jgi:hypothetical protein
LEFSFFCRKTPGGEIETRWCCHLAEVGKFGGFQTSAAGSWLFIQASGGWLKWKASG